MNGQGRKRPGGGHANGGNPKNEPTLLYHAAKISMVNPLRLVAAVETEQFTGAPCYSLLTSFWVSSDRKCNLN